jgi:hypothetical protein
MAPLAPGLAKDLDANSEEALKGRDVEFLPRYAVIQTAFDSAWLKKLDSGPRELAENAEWESVVAAFVDLPILSISGEFICQYPNIILWRPLPGYREER